MTTNLDKCTVNILKKISNKNFECDCDVDIDRDTGIEVHDEDCYVHYEDLINDCIVDLKARIKSDDADVERESKNENL